MNGPETYRGIPVPDRVRRDRDENRPYAAVFHAWREGVDAALALLRPMVESLHYDTPSSIRKRKTWGHL